MTSKKIFSLTTLWYLAFATAIAIVVPIIFNVINLTDVQKYTFAFFGINVIFTILSGLIVGIKKQPIIYLLFFPAIYLIGVNLFFESFAYYIAIVYLLIGFLTYGAVKD
ncbi:MAG: hypothetical protein ABF991_01130 [Liquorilactobacillus hordei]|uniref:Integral membrane protein n=2 Tax=Liquorilactobacillus hordei TaxID=468911 RepID=A0A0R1MLA7_9LACO|nr:hypothetical protein [Liquorilactobacillus hordei]AUJ29892.1 hypothetical protein BSQ49_06610 [Liquorilactobacillus hordei]KRL08281.1 hypothetical protein FC92_GL000071 [Liquorilactobacillus hordei DSM 19519]MBZ2404851.1 hypothetical protein [Liquorilactobacillus hordei]QYH52500.1 hypothetical protein G6O70_08700 [Liquorilactobacillus hordei DSM 19519]